MPVNAFMDFLPKTLAVPMWITDGFASIPKTGKEEDIYPPLVNALNASDSAPGLMFIATSASAEHSGVRASIKPDIAAYPTTTPKKVYTRKSEETPFVQPGYVDMIIEVKTSLDPFDDPPENTPGGGVKFVLNINDKQRLEYATEALGQLTRYAAVVFARQHRWACFQILVVGGEARFLRWDRSGVIVSRKFDYTTNPQILCEFLWRYTHAHPKERGYDDTVTLESPQEEQLFQDVVIARLIKDAPFLADFTEAKSNSNGQKMPGKYESPQAVAKRKLKEYYVKGHVSVVRVNESKYLISRPVVTPLEIATRGTRGYWAVCTKTKKVVFLKDTWRYDVKGMVKESENIKKITHPKLDNIPHFVEDEDVANQSTKTATFKSAEWRCFDPDSEERRPTPRIHYRMVTKDAGYSMRLIRGSYDVFSATTYVVKTLVQVFILLGLLHRDISPKNIILLPNYDTPEYKAYEIALNSGDEKAIEQSMIFMVFKAMLIDWELMILANKDSPREYVMTGTWQYMASNIQQLNGDPHTVLHDLESTMWVVLMMALRWLPHTGISTEALCEVIVDLFNEVKMVKHPTKDKLVVSGGYAKGVEITLKYSTKNIKFSPTFDAWYRAIRKPIMPTIAERLGGEKWQDLYDLSEGNLQALVSIWESATAAYAQKPHHHCDWTNHGTKEPAFRKLQLSRATMPSLSSLSLSEASQASVSTLGKRKVDAADGGRDGDEALRLPPHQRSPSAAEAGGKRTEATEPTETLDL